MKTTTIKIDHPSADEIMKLEELKEACFRISEHITEYRENVDLNMAYLTDDDRRILAESCQRVIDYTERAAWIIKGLKDTFGNFPLK